MSGIVFENKWVFLFLIGCNMVFSQLIIAQKAEAEFFEKKIQEPIKSDRNIQLADSLIRVFDYKTAMTYAEKGLSLLENRKDWEGYVQAFNQLGLQLIKRQEYERAIALFDKGLRKSIQFLPKEKWLLYADTYHHLGIAYRKKGNYDKALHLHHQCLDTQLKFFGENDPALGKTYYTIGNVLYNQGDFEASLRYNLKALNIQLQISQGNAANIASTYNNIGLIHLKLNNNDHSIEAYQKALEIYQNIYFPEHPQIASMYSNIAGVYAKEGRYEDAIDMSKKSISLLEPVFDKSHPDFVINFNTLGDVYLAQKQFQKSISYYEFALKSRQQNLSNKHPYIAESYLKIAEVYRQQQNFSKALTYCQQALIALVGDFANNDMYSNPPLQKVSSETYLLQALQAKAAIFEAWYETEPNVKYLEQALATYQLAARLVRYMATYYLSDGFNLFEPEDAIPAYEGGIRVALRLTTVVETAQQQSLYATVFELMEQHKKTFYLAGLKNASLTRFIGIPSATIEKERSLKIDLSYYKRKLLDENQRAEVKDANIIKALESQIQYLHQQYDSLVLEFKQKYLQYYELKYDTTVVSLASVKSQLSWQWSNQVAIVEYFVGEKNIYILSIHTEGVQLYEKTLNPDFLYDYADFLATITDYNLLVGQPESTKQKFAKGAYEFYELLLKDALSNLKAPTEHLMIIPDGVLYYLPFDALLAQPASAKSAYSNFDFLIKKYRITPAISLTRLLKKNNKKTLNKLKTFTGFGVQYDMPQFSLSNDLILPRFEKEEYRTLPQAEKTIEIVGDMLKGQVFIGGEATENAVKTKATDNEILQLYLHGVLDDKNALYSQFLFQLSKDSLEDGRLHLAELYNTTLNNQHLVLNCMSRTERTYFIHRESITHLVNAADYAGTPSVLFNLWQTDGQVTDNILQNFYTKVQNNTPWTVALQEAKLHYIDNNHGAKGHPYFWAGMVNIGVPDGTHERSMSVYWWLGGCLLLCGLAFSLFLAIRRKNT